MSARVDTAVPMAATPSGDPMRILVVEDEVKRLHSSAKPFRPKALP